MQFPGSYPGRTIGAKQDYDRKGEMFLEKQVLVQSIATELKDPKEVV
jgi:hypothetical protein